MTRVIIHAGFHKTGTTSLQRFLEINAEALAPHVRVILKPQMEALAACARDCSNAMLPSTLMPRRLARAAFKKQFAALLKTTALEPNQTLLISCEALVGRMPGRENIMAFDAAAGLAEDMLTVATQHFGPDLNITFFYTTRAKDAWMRSAYTHLLQQTKFTMSMDEFTTKYARAGDLDVAISNIAKAIAPLKPVVSRLEDTSPKHFGPASELLELLNLPSEVIATLQSPLQINRGIDAFEQRKMMEFNLGTSEGEDLILQKRRFLRKRRNRLKRRLDSD